MSQSYSWSIRCDHREPLSLWGQNSNSYILASKIKFGIETKPELKKETLALKHLYWKKLYWHWNKYWHWQKVPLKNKTQTLKKITIFLFCQSSHFFFMSFFSDIFLCCQFFFQCHWFSFSAFCFSISTFCQCFGIERRALAGRTLPSMPCGLTKISKGGGIMVDILSQTFVIFALGLLICHFIKLSE